MVIVNQPKDPIGASARKAAAARRVGMGRTCSVCGEARPEALTAGREPMICTECDRRSRGQSSLDDHHVAGQSNSPVTIPVSANDHRAELSEMQREWPEQTLRNPDGSPALAAAAWIRGFVDTLIYLIKQGLLWAAEMLEALDQFLREKLGRHWWHESPLEQFAPKGKCNGK